MVCVRGREGEGEGGREGERERERERLGVWMMKILEYKFSSSLSFFLV